MRTLDEKEKKLISIIFAFILTFPTNYILFTQNLVISEKIFISIWTTSLLIFWIYAHIDLREIEKIRKNK